MALYPEHEWLPWKFSAPPKGWASDQVYQAKFLKYIQSQLAKDNKGADVDLKRLTRRFIDQHGGTSNLSLFAVQFSMLIAFREGDITSF